MCDPLARSLYFCGAEFCAGVSGGELNHVYADALLGCMEVVVEDIVADIIGEERRVHALWVWV